jgi:quinoprotein glucose dehydrogenase
MTVRVAKFSGVVVAAAALASALLMRPQAAPVPGDWPAYGGNKGGTKYSQLDQINKDTVRNLRIVWRQSATPQAVRQGHSDAPVPISYEHTPLMVDGLLYISTGYGTVAALDPTTGEVVWFDSPFAPAPNGSSDRQPPRGPSSRSLAYWSDGKDARIIAITGQYLVALNAATGKRYPNFGQGGEIDLAKGYRRVTEGGYRWSGPPLVIRDVIIVGGLPGGASDIVTETARAKRETPPGDIRGFDVRSGKLLWTFHTIPEPGEFGNDTWLNDSWSYSGNTGVWASMSGDEELGYVYLPIETPTGDYYGGTRHGNNLFAESMVCLDAKTGKRVWHFQAVHHGIWDYDFPAPPVLADITVNGRRTKAVAQISKQSFVYVLDRVTGKPVWPIVERPVPKGDAPGEWYAPTQPFPTKPPAYEQQGVSPDDLMDFTPELRQEALQIINQYKYGPLFTPFGVPGTPDGKKGTILMPSSIGGSNWPGAGLDPETGILYVPSVKSADVVELVKSTHPESNIPLVRRNAFLPEMWVLGPRGLPSPFKPPYGRLSAIDLNKGEILWAVPNGNGPRDHPALKDLNLPPLGQGGRVGPLVTKSLVFLGEGGDFTVHLPPGGGGKMFRAYDKTTGRVVWETELGGGNSAPPITYMARGKQYIVLAVAWKGYPAELVALALP